MKSRAGFALLRGHLSVYACLCHLPRRGEEALERRQGATIGMDCPKCTGIRLLPPWLTVVRLRLAHWRSEVESYRKAKELPKVGGSASRFGASPSSAPHAPANAAVWAVAAEIR